MSAEQRPSSWVKSAGHARIRTIQRWMFAVGAAPFAWFLVERNFSSAGFHWAVLGLITVPVLATAWAAIRLRCPVCGIPVYAFYLLGLRPSRERVGFDALSRCPYCLDDGTGKRGDPSRVDPRREAGLAIRRVLVAVGVFAAIIGAAFLLMVLGWLPGYEGLSRTR